jgi:hypothetical protein
MAKFILVAWLVIAGMTTASATDEEDSPDRGRLAGNYPARPGTLAGDYRPAGPDGRGNPFAEGLFPLSVLMANANRDNPAAVADAVPNEPVPRMAPNGLMARTMANLRPHNGEQWWPGATLATWAAWLMARSNRAWARECAGAGGWTESEWYDYFETGETSTWTGMQWAVYWLNPANWGPRRVVSVLRQYRRGAYQG